LALTVAGCRSHNDVAFAPDEITPVQRLGKLGKLAFFDESLSEPPGQACATCHNPETAFTDGRGSQPTSRGVLAGRFGVRNTPTAMYAARVPPLHYSKDDNSFVGGLFWDGRVDSLEQQAQKPLLNPLEMNNAGEASVAKKLCAAPYAYLLREVFGSDVLDDDHRAYVALSAAIAAFERQPRFAPFSSKYDAFLAGTATLTAAETRGLAVFEDPKKGNCSACHPSRPDKDGKPPVFTDFTYDNLGIPANPANPYYSLPATLNPDGAGYVDRGLGFTIGAEQDGRFRVPTLRNIARTAPYGHNGYFADLRAIVDFYNTRDTKPWPPAEVPATVNHDELGNLGLSDGEVEDLVTFMFALDDGYTP
jgi:cytochrome c peroxidase